MKSTASRVPLMTGFPVRTSARASILSSQAGFIATSILSPSDGVWSTFYRAGARATGSAGAVLEDGSVGAPRVRVPGDDGRVSTSAWAYEPVRGVHGGGWSAGNRDVYRSSYSREESREPALDRFHTTGQGPRPAEAAESLLMASSRALATLHETSFPRSSKAARRGPTAGHGSDSTRNAWVSRRSCTSRNESRRLFAGEREVSGQAEPPLDAAGATPRPRPAQSGRGRRWDAADSQ